MPWDEDVIRFLAASGIQQFVEREISQAVRMTSMKELSINEFYFRKKLIKETSMKKNGNVYEFDKSFITHKFPELIKEFPILKTEKKGK